MSVKVTILKNGPIRIEGDFEINDFEGGVFGLAGRQAISLCRCGNSENKPFCDGNHGRTGFMSECKARNLPPPVQKL
jgi:CDGSH-type Zn-finger protein